MILLWKCYYMTFSAALEEEAFIMVYIIGKEKAVFY